MRALGVDIGARRIGLALSDPTGTLASPWDTIVPRAGADPVGEVVARIDRRRFEGEDRIGVIVIGLPRHLDGREHELAPGIRTFAARLEHRTGIQVVLQDERLTSHEAETRLAERERDWRARKRKLDAAAAAVILQEYLDSPR